MGQRQFGIEPDRSAGRAPVGAERAAVAESTAAPGISQIFDFASAFGAYRTSAGTGVESLGSE